MLYVYWGKKVNTVLLELISVSTKNYQVISNSMGVMACTNFQLQENKYIMEKVRVLLHATCLLVLIYASTKYYKDISNHKEVMECTRIWLRISFMDAGITRERTKQELAFLHAILYLTSMGVMTCTRFRHQGT